MSWTGSDRSCSARPVLSKQLEIGLGCVLGAVSGFLLNTAVVVMFMPVVLDWCRRHRIAPSRMLLPLSYLVILGGVCTLVGNEYHARIEWKTR